MKSYYVARATGAYLTDMLIASVDAWTNITSEECRRYLTEFDDAKEIKGYVEKGYQATIKCKYEEEDA